MIFNLANPLRFQRLIEKIEPITLNIAIILLLERFDNAFRSSGALEKATGHPCFELIPEVKNMGRRELAEFIINKPTSGMAEAVRNLRTVIKLRGGPKNISPKVVLMTSSFPGEGKTTLSSWLGRISAKSGEKVIAINGSKKNLAT